MPCLDSPSRQLLSELGRLRISADGEFFARLEREAEQREQEHRAALSAAAAEHARVRESAIVASQQYQIKLEQEKLKRDEEERRALEHQRRAKAQAEIERRQREIEDAQRVEAERKSAEAERKRLDEQRQRLLKDKEDAERRRALKEKEEAESTKRLKDQEEADAKKRLQAQAQADAQAKIQQSPRQEFPATISEPTSASAPSSTSNEKEVEHHHFVQLHKNLKDLRKFMMDQGKQNKELKTKMGDMRRELRKCVGQLTEGKGANRPTTTRIQAILKEAMVLPSPAVDMRNYIKAREPSATNGSDLETQAPGLFVYLLNIFSKAIVAQFIDEAGVSPKSADPVGVVAVQIFSANDFRWRGRSLIDMLIAKFHVVCPVLFGIYGNEKTDIGRKRLGWGREEKNGPWVSEQRHSERMTGLGAGYAAIALRNFEKSKLENPYPNWNYWRSLANIVNVPPAEVTQTHFMVLKAMIENYEQRFLEFYGHAALAALRRALVDMPNQVQDKGVAGTAISVLPDMLKKDKNFHLV